MTTHDTSQTWNCKKLVYPILFDIFGDLQMCCCQFCGLYCAVFEDSCDLWSSGFLTCELWSTVWLKVHWFIENVEEEILIWDEGREVDGRGCRVVVVKED